VKPANLLLDRGGRVHVADFGIASAAGTASLTQTGTVLGTASYLSPEQAQGERTTAASDLYSLAVVAFELFTGRRPFEAGSVAAEAAAHVTGEVPSVCDVNPQAPCELDPVFAKALAKDPAQRYTSGAEFVAALRASLEHAAGATHISGYAAPPPAPPRERSRWLVPVLASALVIAGIAAAVALTRGGGSGKPQPVAVKTVIRSVTTPGQTVVKTAFVTTSAPPPTTPSTTPSTTAAAAPPPSTGGDPVAENNRAYEMMKAGDYNSALPLLQDAAAQLQGQGNLAEAYTDYNLGFTLMQLGNCSDALTWLERSRALQPSRKEVKDAIKQARSC
jgi:serine/threonine protein kinase